MDNSRWDSRIMYVLGFLFSPEKKKVALILKDKPAWQKGFYNGIGGKVQAGEPLLTAMIREFKEETGYHYTNWEQYAHMENNNFICYCFKGFADLSQLRTNETEIVTIVDL